MALSDQEVNEFKKQIKEHVTKNFPPEQQAQAISQVEAMNGEELEEFLKKNNAIQNEDNSPFRLIIQKKIKATVVEDTPQALAVLEINPIAKGHILIIPKEKVTSEEQLPKECTELSTSIAQKLQERLSPKPKDVTIFISESFGEITINVVPVYTDEGPNSPRNKASPEELEEVEIAYQTPPKKEEKKPGKNVLENTRIPKRIP